MGKALTRQGAKRDIEFGKGETIMKKYNQDYKVFKLYKSELIKSTNSNNNTENNSRLY